MTLLKNVGVADPSCQLYMLFFYIGPGLLIFPTIFCASAESRPSLRVISKAIAVAIWDLMAMILNYTGAALAGPTIFAIIYSSVAIWTAVLSRFLLNRSMNHMQWIFVFTVFGGLALTAMDSFEAGGGVSKGLVLVVVGSIMHGLFYVMSEAVMTVGDERLTVKQNCAVQNFTAACIFFLWQIVYTLPRVDEKLWAPMQAAGTTFAVGLSALLLFSLANSIHAITFYHTLRHFPGGATSAGVMKGLQAVFVFVLSDWIYCGRIGGKEMCFTTAKFFSLISVVGGVFGYGMVTGAAGGGTQSSKKNNEGYERIQSDHDLEMLPSSSSTSMILDKAVPLRSEDSSSNNGKF